MPNDSGRPGYHNRHSCIVAKISSLLASLAQEPSRSREETARTLEYWIGYVLTEQFTTVDELVEGVSYIAWEGGNPYIVASFLKEFRNAPAVPSKRHRSWTSYASAFFGGFRSPQPKTTIWAGVTPLSRAMEGTTLYARRCLLGISSSVACSVTISCGGISSNHWLSTTATTTTGPTPSTNFSSLQETPYSRASLNPTMSRPPSRYWTHRSD
jgi:hypothetical protein